MHEAYCTNTKGLLSTPKGYMTCGLLTPAILKPATS